MSGSFVPLLIDVASGGNETLASGGLVIDPVRGKVYCQGDHGSSGSGLQSNDLTSGVMLQFATRTTIFGGAYTVVRDLMEIDGSGNVYVLYSATTSFAIATQIANLRLAKIDLNLTLVGSQALLVAGATPATFDHDQDLNLGVVTNSGSPYVIVLFSSDGTDSTGNFFQLFDGTSLASLGTVVYGVNTDRTLQSPQRNSLMVVGENSGADSRLYVLTPELGRSYFPTLTRVNIKVTPPSMTTTAIKSYVPGDFSPNWTGATDVGFTSLVFDSVDNNLIFGITSRGAIAPARQSFVVKVSSSTGAVMWTRELLFKGTSQPALSGEPMHSSRWSQNGNLIGGQILYIIPGSSSEAGDTYAEVFVIDTATGAATVEHSSLMLGYDKSPTVWDGPREKLFVYPLIGNGMTQIQQASPYWKEGLGMFGLVTPLVGTRRLLAELGPVRTQI